MKLSSDVMKKMAIVAGCATIVVGGVVVADEPKAPKPAKQCQATQQSFTTYVKLLNAKGIKSVVVDGKAVVLQTVKLETLEKAQKAKVEHATAVAYEKAYGPRKFIPRGGNSGDSCPGCGRG